MAYREFANTAANKSRRGNIAADPCSVCCPTANSDRAFALYVRFHRTYETQGPSWRGRGSNTLDIEARVTSGVVTRRIERQVVDWKRVGNAATYLFQICNVPRVMRNRKARLVVSVRVAVWRDACHQDCGRDGNRSICCLRRFSHYGYKMIYGGTTCLREHAYALCSHTYS